MKTCALCGAENENDAPTCAKCGEGSWFKNVTPAPAPVVAPEPEPEPEAPKRGRK